MVTNLERSKLIHLDSLHKYLHAFGKTDEERVFMFYGLVAIHYKYDNERMNQGRKATEYTPYYTAKIKKGVCRDFSALFKELCDRSEIPCLDISGRVDVPFLKVPKNIISYGLNKPNHAWNLVKFNNAWHTMDPTWSFIQRTEKYYGKDKYGRKVYLGKVKIAYRDYYDIDPERLSKTRNVIHPAYYLTDTVYTYKSVRKSENKREIYQNGYNFNAILDSLTKDTLFIYSSTFSNEAMEYNGEKSMGFSLANEFNFLKLKRTPFNPITKDLCEQQLKELEIIVNYLKQNGKGDLSPNLTQLKLEVDNYKKKLDRQEMARRR